MTESEHRDIDRKVARLIGDVWVPDDPARPDGDGWWVSKDGTKVSQADGGPARYSSDWGAMGRLIQVIQKHHWNFRCTAPTQGPVRVEFFCNLGPCPHHNNTKDDWHSVSAEADTLPEAVALASIKAMGVTKTQGDHLIDTLSGGDT